MSNCNQQTCSLLPLREKHKNHFPEVEPEITLEVHTEQWYEFQDKYLESGQDLNYDGSLMGY